MGKLQVLNLNMKSGLVFHPNKVTFSTLICYYYLFSYLKINNSNNYHNENLPIEMSLL